MNLDNFLLTNYLEFRLYVGGELVDSAKLSAPPDKGTVKIFYEDTDALEMLLERFLSGELPPISLPRDLFVEDTENRIIVEIQNIKEGDFFDRFLYYHLISLVEQVKSRVGYHFEKTVYTVVVLTGVSKPKNSNVDFSVAISDFCPINERGKKINVYGHRLVFWLRNEQTPKSVNAWLELIEDSLDEKIDESRYRDSSIFQKVIDEINPPTPFEKGGIKLIVLLPMN